MTRNKKQARRGTNPPGGRRWTNVNVSSKQNYTLTQHHCQVCALVGQAAVLAWKAWLRGEFRKAAAHNAVFLALLDLAAGEGA